MNKVHSIQLLRGFASLVVLLHHALHKEESFGAGYFGSFDFGHIGVDIFFVISGFVMLYTFNPNNNASHFLIKRAIRILPVYWATLSVIIAVYLVFPQLVNAGRESTILGSIFLIPLNDQLFLNQNAWTLTYEFIFYFIFAFIFLFRSILGVLGVVFLILGLSFIGEFCAFNFLILEYLTSSLLLEFIYGFILYSFYMHFSIKQKRALILFLLGLVIGLQFIEVNSSYRMIYLGIPALFICTVIVYFEAFIRQFLEKVSDFLGDISYSLYLVHPMSLAASAITLSWLGITQPFLFLGVLIISSIILGWLVYMFVEVPLTKKCQLIYSRSRQK